MTPALSAVHTELLERAVVPPFEARTKELRRQFHERCGHYEPDHPAREARDRAAWDDVLVEEGLALEIAPSLRDAAERDLAERIARAQRGLFVFLHAGGAIIARDLWSRAEFLLAKNDDLARGLHRQTGGDPAVCDARIVGLPEGGVTLPGFVFHPADARELVERALGAARGGGLPRRSAFDGLLKMEHSFRTLSRVSVRYAYRAP